MAEELVNVAAVTARALAELAGVLAGAVEAALEGPVPYVDVVELLPVHPSPTAPAAWWVRTPEQITGVTIHHTMSEDLFSTARYCVWGKGRPSTEYHFWVTRSGGVYRCAPLEWGLWHDHCGHQNRHVSVGMAGWLHQNRPSAEQIAAAARLVRWLTDPERGLNGGRGIAPAGVQGHCDRYAGTICPGWDATGWRAEFMAAVAG
jgi:hypothetical protein